MGRRAARTRIASSGEEASHELGQGSTAASGEQELSAECNLIAFPNHRKWMGVADKSLQKLGTLYAVAFE